MKTSELDILVIPGLTGGTDEHWYRRWASKLSTAQIVQQTDWHSPDKEMWTKTIHAAISASSKPVFLIAHSTGTLAAIHTVALGNMDKVKGAFLAAVPDPNFLAQAHPETASFVPVPSDPLPFPSMMVATRNDQYCSFERAEELALDWGALLIDGGEHGHLNPDSGHGPWPEGLMALSKFLNRL